MSGISKLEADYIRSMLRIRYNYASQCWEVYTTIHGSGVFRWMKVSGETAKWYIERFNPTYDDPINIDHESGALTDKVTV